MGHLRVVIYQNESGWDGRVKRSIWDVSGTCVGRDGITKLCLGRSWDVNGKVQVSVWDEFGR